MNKRDLKKLSKSELIKLLLKQEKKKPKIIVVDDTKHSPKPRRPTPTPRKSKSVKDLVDFFERKLLPPPPKEWLDEIDKKTIPLPRTKKPVPLQRTKIEQTEKALKGYTKSYEINIKNNNDPLVQLQNTRTALTQHMQSILKGLTVVCETKWSQTKWNETK